MLIMILQEVTQYRKEYQRPEDRREFDLNDPDYVKKDQPARVSTLSSYSIIIMISTRHQMLIQSVLSVGLKYFKERI